MDWKIVAQSIIWSDNTLQEKEDMINQLLDQRDEEIIGKLEEHIENDCDDLTSKYYIEAINHAISTIKETRKK